MIVLDSALALGQVVDGRYRLARFCGNGASGWALASDEVVGQCAVKLLQPRQVSWLDAVSFCNALSRRVGLEEAYLVLSYTDHPEQAA